MTRNELKDVYRLWVEYLKLSLSYQEYCDLMKRKKEIPLSLLPNEFKGKEGLIVNYMIFGNIFEKSFEEIWPSIDFWNAVASPISDFGESISSLIDNCIDNFKKEHGKEPTSQDIKNILVKTFDDPTKLYLKIDLTKGTLDEIVDQFKNMINEYRNVRIMSHFINQSKISSSLFLKQHTRVNLKKLQRCLDIYKLKKIERLTMKQVIEKIGDKADIDDPSDKDIQSPYWRDLKRAKDIIEHIEKCTFP